MICAVVANVMGGGKRFEPRDFLPNWTGTQQTDEQMLAVVADIFGPKET